MQRNKLAIAKQVCIVRRTVILAGSARLLEIYPAHLCELCNSILFDRMVRRCDVAFVFQDFFGIEGSSFDLQSVWIRHMRAARRNSPRRSFPISVVRKGVFRRTPSAILTASRVPRVKKLTKLILDTRKQAGCDIRLTSTPRCVWRASRVYTKFQSNSKQITDLSQRSFAPFRAIADRCFFDIFAAQPTLTAKRHGGRILPSDSGVGISSSISPVSTHDMNGIADNVGRAALAFGASRHCLATTLGNNSELSKSTRSGTKIFSVRIPCLLTHDVRERTGIRLGPASVRCTSPALISICGRFSDEWRARFVHEPLF